MSRPSLRRAFAALAMTVSVTGAAQAQGFDHGAFDALLHKHVVNGMVNYDAFKAAPEFKGYLKALAATDPATMPRDEQLAFWINAYNAYTIELIVSHNETESIRNINKTLFLKLKGPWAEPLAKVGGKDYTLDDIEHKIIRPTYKEPRIHFALVCAAMGCPPLRSEAYAGAKLNAQLEDQGVQFILKSPAKNRVDVASKTLYHSMIFGYYKEDFGGTIQGSAKFMAKWFADGPEKQMLMSGDFKAVQTDYDWTLNSQVNARKIAQR